MTIRFGVAGAAYWAGVVHMPGVVAAQGATLAGVWGRTPDRAAALAAQFGVRAYARFSDMLADVDAVAIAVHPEAQPALALAAAEAGKHAILEKPLAKDAAVARQIRDAFRRRDAAALVFFLRRFAPEIATSIEAARGVAWRRADVRACFAALSPGGPFSRSPWRREPNAAFWDIGPHALSIVLPLLGPVAEIIASPEEDGLCRMRTLHRNGAVAEIALSLNAAAGETCCHYAFRAEDRAVTLPDVDLDRPAAFTIAVEALVAMIGAGRRDHACDLDFGAGISDLLASATSGL